MKNYINQAIQTESPVTPELIERLTSNARMIHAYSGLVTETGEFVDSLKRNIFYGTEIDKINLIEELGNILWYMALACDVLGITFETVMERNIEKLQKKRYKGGKFTAEEAVNRDTTEERKALEGEGAGDGRSGSMEGVVPGSLDREADTQQDEDPLGEKRDGSTANWTEFERLVITEGAGHLNQAERDRLSQIRENRKKRQAEMLGASLSTTSDPQQQWKLEHGIPFCICTVVYNGDFPEGAITNQSRNPHCPHHPQEFNA